MSKIFTVANVAIVVSLLMSLYSVLKSVASKTKTTADDKLIDLVEKARPWVFNFASLVWPVVETLANSGKIDKLSKFAEYMTILRDGFKKAFGQDMPEALEADAQLVAQGLSAIDKLDKGIEINPTDPAAKEASALKPPV